MSSDDDDTVPWSSGVNSGTEDRRWMSGSTTGCDGWPSATTTMCRCRPRESADRTTLAGMEARLGDALGPSMQEHRNQSPYSNLGRIARMPLKCPLSWVPLDWVEIWAADHHSAVEWDHSCWLDGGFCVLTTIFMLIVLIPGFITNWKDRIQGLLKDLKLQFSSTKSIDKTTYHTRAVTTNT